MNTEAHLWRYGAYRTRLGQHLRKINTCSCQLPLMLVSCGAWRASVHLGCSAAVPSCALVCSVLTSCPLKMCRLARRPCRGDSKHRTRPGEPRLSLRNCQHPSVLVSCGCAADVCDLCLVTFRANRAFTADHQRESARYVSNTRRGIVEAVADPTRECAKDETPPMKLSSLQVQYSRG